MRTTVGDTTIGPPCPSNSKESWWTGKHLLGWTIDGIEEMDQMQRRWKGQTVPAALTQSGFFALSQSRLSSPLSPSDTNVFTLPDEPMGSRERAMRQPISDQLLCWRQNR
ncbi:hypothetical protein NQZ68_040584 [Dissostichus eleginoides]|nr:hypothetical protein NQZ68_040814 [Dissostichus eleginoides]KAI9540412.1 hypothetical protein NQZ68_040584 [Dissostichus eleginoides]